MNDNGFVFIWHLHFTSDFTPSDLNLFPKIEKKQQKKRIADIHIDIIHEAEDVLNGQEKDCFKSAIESFKHRWQKCIATDGDYAEKHCNKSAKVKPLYIRFTTRSIITPKQS